MSRLVAIRSALAAAFAALLVLTFAVAPASATPAVATAAGEGVLNGTIVGASGDEDFEVMLLPITGTGVEDYRDVSVSGAGAFSLDVPAGSYHVKVFSQEGLSETAWFGDGVARDEFASRIVIKAGQTTTVHWVLGDDPGGFHGTLDGVDPGELYFVGAFFDGGSGRLDRYDSSYQIFTSEDPWELDGLAPGPYTLVFQSLDYVYETKTVEVTVTAGANTNLGAISINALPDGPHIDRIQGTDRYDTAVKVAQDVFDSAPNTVFIVNGENYPDALSAGPAAVRAQAPILLVKPGSIPQTVKNQLDDWMPDNIFIIGGTGAVSATVESQLHAYASHVTRVSGSDRYATSRAVFNTFITDPGTIYLANGTNFPDALGAGPAASLRGGAVLLVRGSSAHLDAPTKAIIDALPATFPIQIAGGTGSVSKGIDDDLFSLVHDHRRRAGIDRYATAAAISYGSFAQTNTIYLATGANFPDALAAGAAAGRLGAPVLLVKQNCIPLDAMDEIQSLRPSRIVLLGGPTVISDQVKLHLTPCST